ncbi:hypothetical protein [Microbacterium hominis]|nr:hypothetical protein [Microbacterium hominis]
MASQQQRDGEHSGGVMSGGGSPTLWGVLSGLVVAAFIAVPLSAAVSFATHPGTQQLFGGRLEEATTGGYQAFWWIVAIFLVALPVLVGWGVARLSGRTLAIIGAIIALFIIAVLIMGQMFVF